MPGAEMLGWDGYGDWPFMILRWGLIILAVILIARRLDSTARDRWTRNARLRILERHYGPRRSAKKTPIR